MGTLYNIGYEGRHVYMSDKAGVTPTQAGQKSRPKNSVEGRVFRFWAAQTFVNIAIGFYDTGYWVSGRGCGGVHMRDRTYCTSPQAKRCCNWCTIMMVPPTGSRCIHMAQGQVLKENRGREHIHFHPNKAAEDVLVSHVLVKSA